jgi:hypothetical protein
MIVEERLKTFTRLLVSLETFEWAGSREGHLYWSQVHEICLNALTLKRTDEKGMVKDKPTPLNTPVSPAWLRGVNEDALFECENALRSAFIWDNTPQGNDSWQDVAKRLLAIASRELPTTNQPVEKENTTMARTYQELAISASNNEDVLEKHPLPWTVQGDIVTDKFNRNVDIGELAKLQNLNTILTNLEASALIKSSDNGITTVTIVPETL